MRKIKKQRKNDAKELKQRKNDAKNKDAKKNFLFKISIISYFSLNECDNRLFTLKSVMICNNNNSKSQ